MLSADKGSFIIGRKTGQKHEKTRKEEESENVCEKKKLSGNDGIFWFGKKSVCEIGETDAVIVQVNSTQHLRFVRSVFSCALIDLITGSGRQTPFRRFSHTELGRM